jgi:enamine deaminase RidA (YjgF/YER057c/UK114 family)
MAEQRESAPGGAVHYLQPDGLHKNPAYINVVTVTGATKTVYVGAQGALDAAGTIVGKGDVAAQTEQVLKNIETALAVAGATVDHIIKVSVYIAHGQPLQAAFAIVQRRWGSRPNPPTNAVLFVPELVPSDFLIAVDAIAVVP